MFRIHRLLHKLKQNIDITIATTAIKVILDSFKALLFIVSILLLYQEKLLDLVSKKLKMTLVLKITQNLIGKINHLMQL